MKILKRISHIPDKGEQTVKYLEYYSNATRGRLKKDSQSQYHIIVDDIKGGLNKSPGHILYKRYTSKFL